MSNQYLNNHETIYSIQATHQSTDPRSHLHHVLPAMVPGPWRRSRRSSLSANTQTLHVSICHPVVVGHEGSIYGSPIRRVWEASSGNRVRFPRPRRSCPFPARIAFVRSGSERSDGGAAGPLAGGDGSHSGSTPWALLHRLLRLQAVRDRFFRMV